RELTKAAARISSVASNSNLSCSLQEKKRERERASEGERSIIVKQILTSELASDPYIYTHVAHCCAQLQRAHGDDKEACVRPRHPASAGRPLLPAPRLRGRQPEGSAAEGASRHLRRWWTWTGGVADDDDGGGGGCCRAGS
uniref:Uncharacterized protein n=1 Tax=Zea mays TaxID=4577 RepID=A0A804N260_MAIZE